MYNEIFTVMFYFFAFLGMLRFARFALIAAAKVNAAYHKYRTNRIDSIEGKLDYAEALAHRTLARIEWIQEALRYVPFVGDRLAKRFDAHVQMVRFALKVNDELRKVAARLEAYQNSGAATLPEPHFQFPKPEMVH